MISMDPEELIQLTRRDFLVNAARGVGGLAFASLLKADQDAVDFAVLGRGQGGAEEEEDDHGSVPRNRVRL